MVWARTRRYPGTTRKTMIVALARKLLIALWRLVTTGEVPQGVVLRLRLSNPDKKEIANIRFRRPANGLADHNPEVAVTRGRLGLHAGLENGPAVSELCRRCA